MSLDVFQVVLVVDDDPGQVAIVTSVLQTAGFRVISATSPPAALDAANGAEELFLLVTDFSMPEMSGRELAIKVRAAHPEVKILYLTAHSDDLFRQAHELEPHEAFLDKPVSAHGLREAVQLLLQGPRAF